MLDFSRFELLTFDCYGTLIDWESGLLPTITQVLRAHDRELDPATILAMYAEFEHLAQSGEYRPYRDVLAHVVRGFAEELGFTPHPDEIDSLAHSLPNWNPWPDTVSALQRLKTRFPLAIISNIDDDLFAPTAARLQVHFDAVITAQQAQAYKPSTKIFNLAFERLNLPRDRILHVAQSVYHDIVPAQALGLSTVWVNRPSARPGVGVVKTAEAKADLQVSSLAALAEDAI